MTRGLILEIVLLFTASVLIVLSAIGTARLWQAACICLLLLRLVESRPKPRVKDEQCRR